MNEINIKKSFWARNAALLLILLLATGLRIYGLADENLWLDEALVNTRISEDYSKLLTDWDSQRQGPLYPAIVKAWCDEFGNDEFNLRFTAALFGILGVFAIFGLGRELFGRNAGLWAAAFAAISPSLIYFSQESRPYTLLILGSCASIMYYLRILKGDRRFLSILFFLVSATFALYSHAYGPFLVLTFGLMTVGYYFHEQESILALLKKISIPAAALIVLYSPMLYIFAQTFLRKLDDPTVAGSWLVAKPITDIGSAVSGYFMWPPLAIAAVLFLAGVLGYHAIWKRRWNLPVTVTACILFSFLFVPWLISYTITPIFSHKYTIVSLGAILALLGYALTLLASRWRIAVLSLLFLLSAWPLYNYYTKQDKTPWRKTAEILNEHCGKGDMVLLKPSYAISPFRYYYDIKNKDIIFRRLRHAAEHRSIPDNIDHVWFVFSHYHAPRSGDEMFDVLANWGTPNPTILVNELVEMNPYLYFASNIEITRFDRK